jgi:hypothetical protein
MVLFGIGGHVALRMTSLLPKDAGGRGVRNNKKKRRYIADHLSEITYRTMACLTRDEAAALERRLKADGSKYMFPT